MSDAREQVNSLGMRLMRIEAGSFVMGAEDRPLPPDLGPVNCPNEHPPRGDYDERPAHRVIISKPFHIGACEVTNAQYEQFDPAHRALRGKLGFSRRDDDAVVFVSWRDAARFCAWLARKEGQPYRLPTEAEWEYACRAGTTTFFHTGDALPEVYHKHNRPEKWQGFAWYPARGTPEEAAVDLTVGRSPPNAWGLHDMHGNVEEWCSDWHGPYEAGEQTDPVGRADGEFRVTRGGSHSTDLYFLRSANRMGTLPEDKHWLIGFRVVVGEMSQTKPLPIAPPAAYQVNVKQAAPRDLARGPDPAQPYFSGPRRYVRIPPGACGPLYRRHNHDPAICLCPNGDLLAIWYSCIDEPGRELCLAASRLRRGAEQWEDASPFWDPPDRNSHAPALWFDGEQTVYQFCGLSAAATWGNLALVLRTSKDNGVTWSKARLIEPEHGAARGDWLRFPRPSAEIGACTPSSAKVPPSPAFPPGGGPEPGHHQPDRMPVQSVFRAQDGSIVLPSDCSGDTALYISRDNGATWADAGGRIAGIHAGVVQLKDGRLLALGRGHDIDDRMPKSISGDMGRTWNYSASPFPPLHNGQRLVLLRLREGPLFFASFCGKVPLIYSNGKPGETNNREPLVVKDAAGRERRIRGLFAALSFDEGETWNVCKPIVPDGVTPTEKELTYGTRFTMDAETGEPLGYLAVCQTPDGVIQLITSQRHYAFNLAWLQAPMPATS